MLTMIIILMMQDLFFSLFICAHLEHFDLLPLIWIDDGCYLCFVSCTHTHTVSTRSSIIDSQTYPVHKYKYEVYITAAEESIESLNRL